MVIAVVAAARALFMIYLWKFHAHISPIPFAPLAGCQCYWLKFVCESLMCAISWCVDLSLCLARSFAKKIFIIIFDAYKTLHFTPHVSFIVCKIARFTAVRQPNHSESNVIRKSRKKKKVPPKKTDTNRINIERIKQRKLWNDEEKNSRTRVCVRWSESVEHLHNTNIISHSHSHIIKKARDYTIKMQIVNMHNSLDSVFFHGNIPFSRYLCLWLCRRCPHSQVFLDKWQWFLLCWPKCSKNSNN